MIRVRRRVVESAMNLAEDLHNFLEDKYGQDAAHAWEESQEDQIVAQYYATAQEPQA